MKKRHLLNYLLRCFALIFGMCAAATSAHAQWSVIPFHDDSDNEISAFKSYTHAVDFFGSPTVNGVPFVTGVTGAFPGGENNMNQALDAPWQPLPGYVTGGSYDLLTDFVWGNPNAFVRLDGLTVGQQYETRFYHRNWDANVPYNRTQIVGVDIDGDSIADDGTIFNADNPVEYVGGVDNVVPTILAYRFTAGATSVQYSFTASNPDNATYHLYALTNEGAVANNRASIPSLFSTGVDDAHVPLPSGATDPHYYLTSSADPAYPGPTTYVVNEAWPIAPAGPWVANSSTSKWIAPWEQQGIGNEPGSYTMLTTFDLTGFVESTAQIQLTAYADNSLDDVILNGVSLGLTAPSFDPASGRFYTINGPFVAGVNTIEFVWSNAPPGINPAGLRIEMRGTAELIPEPSTVVLAGIGLAGLVAFRRRRVR